MRNANVFPIEAIRAPVAGLLPVAVAGGLVIVQAADEVVAIDVTGRRVAWKAALTKTSWKPELTRRISGFGLGQLCVLSAAKIAACLTHTAAGGILVRALELQSGQQRWAAQIPLPPPAEWTEPVRVSPQADTEELDAFFVERQAAVVVAVYRRSRCSEVWRGDGQHFPRPPFRSQVELHEFDIRSGELKRHTRHPDLRAGLFDSRGWEGLFHNRNEIFEIDWETGRARRLMRFDEPVASYGTVGERIHFVRHTSARIVSGSFRRKDPTKVSEFEMRQGRVTNARVLQWDGEAVLQVNETRLFPLDEMGRPGHELKVRPYPYGGAIVGGARIVWCDGHGANFYVFDREEGTLRWHEKSRYGWSGIHRLQPSGRVVGIRTNRRIDLFEPNGERAEVAPLKRQAFSLAAVGEDLDAGDGCDRLAQRRVCQGDLEAGGQMDVMRWISGGALLGS